MKKLIIIGTGVTAKNVYDFVLHHNLYEVAGFAVNREFYNIQSFCNLPVFCLEDLTQRTESDEYHFFIAILWNRLNSDRRKTYDYCIAHGLQLINLVSPTAIIRGNLNGRNIWIGDYVVIQSGVDIAGNVFVRSAAVICHDTIVKSHSFISARAVIGGSCLVGEQSFVGLNATIIDHIDIGSRAIVGAGICLKENLADNSIASYDSSNYHIKQYTSSEIEHKLSVDIAPIT